MPEITQQALELATLIGPHRDGGDGFCDYCAIWDDDPTIRDWAASPWPCDTARLGTVLLARVPRPDITHPTLDLAAIEKQHRSSFCSRCDQAWPCATSRLISEIRRLSVVADAARPWRALTQDELSRGIMLQHWSERPRLRVWCPQPDHALDVPMTLQEGQGMAWEGTCDYCQRAYRLSLEVSGGSA